MERIDDRTTRCLIALPQVLCLLAILTPSRGAAQVGLQVEAGLEGKVRMGRWAPVRVTATNSGEPVNGRVVVSLLNTQTAVPLDLPTAANKRVETTILPPSGLDYYQPSTQSVAAALRAERREAATARVRVQVVSDSARLLVVCGEAAGGLRFLDGVPLADAGWSLPLQEQGRAHSETTATAHVLPAAMPSDWSGLDAADLLVMRDTAWGELEPAQRRAVRRWVEMGGRLLVCGEDPAGFRDEEGQRLLPVRFVGPQPRASLTAFPLPDREPIRASAGLVMTLDARPLPEAVVGLREAGTPILVSRPTGFGTVLWLGFDPFRVPPERETGRRALWSFLIGCGSGASLHDPAFPPLTDIAAAYGPVKTLPHFPSPSRWTLGSFGLVYVAVFGPLNVWLLRRLRRTVRAWLLMPVLSLGMTGGVLALGTTWSQARIVFHTVTVQETMAGSGTARELTYAALFSPTSRGFGLEIEDPAPVVQFLTEGGQVQSNGNGAFPGYRGATTAAFIPELREGGLSVWEQIPVPLWQIQPIQVERAADLGDGVLVELDTRLSGRVTNRTPQALRAAYLQYRGWRFQIGELLPGASRAVTAAGWKRRRMIEQVSRPTSASPEGGAAGGPTPAGGQEPAASDYPAAPAAGNEGDDLFTTAGSQLRGSLERAEVVMVARAPALSPPLRVPGVTRSPAPGLEEGTILVVRAPVNVAAGFSPGAPGQAMSAP